ncbi:MAG: NAD/NADP octopine/nopaline dehydrogenase family protein [Firmicutes bacterium]|nr:NAD/NADP octopine/nopaline dehydrogenase family protein [Bacillota bacterium]
MFAVLGGGHGGMAAAADLALRGFRVRLFELPEFAHTIRPVREAGGIQTEVLPSTGLREGFARLDAVTTDIEEAVTGADVVLVIVPSFAHQRFAELTAPAVRPGQTVLVAPGNFGGALEFALTWKRAGRDPGAVTLAEAESLIYACRKKGPATIWIRGYKRSLRVAALPANRTAWALAVLGQAYPTLEPAQNVLETSLSNPNAPTHLPVMILNAAHIERTGGDFLFYKEGMTPVVGRVIEALDAERLAVGRALGLSRLRSLYEQDLAWYAHQGTFGENICQTNVNNPIYSWSRAPESFDHRYVTEDVPYGLVPLEDLGVRLGVATPTATAVIHLASVIAGRDLRRGARTLTRLGLGDVSVPRLLEMVEETGP